MPRLFAITTTSDRISVGADGRGDVNFTVTNNSPRPLRGQLRVKPLDSAKAEWLNITGETERDFSPNATQQVAVKISVPQGTPAARYSFRLDAVSVLNPDEDYTEGPVVALEVTPTQQRKKPFPWWIIAVAVAALLIVAAAIWLLIPRKVAAPSVVGLPIEQAREQLEAAQLKVETSEQPSTSVSPNHVVSQDPPAGEKVEKDAVVKLIVAGQKDQKPKTATIVFDFIEQAPDAAWTNYPDNTLLAWRVNDMGDSRGQACWWEKRRLEDGSTPARVLFTHPQWVSNGGLTGEYRLPGPIRTGDRFKAAIGFLEGSAVGDVTFFVEALSDADNSPLVVYRQRDISTDQRLKQIDADLNSYIGKTKIRLRVEAGSTPNSDWATWVAPRIETMTR